MQAKCKTENIVKETEQTENITRHSCELRFTAPPSSGVMQIKNQHYLLSLTSLLK